LSFAALGAWKLGSDSKVRLIASLRSLLRTGPEECGRDDSRPRV